MRECGFVIQTELPTGMSAFEFDKGAIHVLSVVGVVGVEYG